MSRRQLHYALPISPKNTHSRFSRNRRTRHRTRPSTQSSHIHHEPPVGTVRTAPHVTPPKSMCDRNNTQKHSIHMFQKYSNESLDSYIDTVQSHSPRTSIWDRPHRSPCHAANYTTLYQSPPKTPTPDFPEIVERGTGLVPRHSPVTFTTNHQLGPSARLPMSRRQSQCVTEITHKNTQSTCSRSIRTSHWTRTSTQSSHIHHEPPFGTVRTAPHVTPPTTLRSTNLPQKHPLQMFQKSSNEAPDSSLDTVQSHSPRTTSWDRPHGSPCHAAKVNV